MSILTVLSNVISPVTKLIDNITTTDEERLTLRNALANAENQMAAQILEYESKIAEMKANVIISEAKGESWLQRSWRPLTMLTFLCLIVAHYCGVLAFPIAEQMWTLLQIGIGGYIASRGAEKVIPGILNKIKAKE